MSSFTPRETCWHPYRCATDRWKCTVTGGSGAHEYAWCSVDGGCPSLRAEGNCTFMHDYPIWSFYSDPALALYFDLAEALSLSLSGENSRLPAASATTTVFHSKTRHHSTTAEGSFCGCDLQQAFSPGQRVYSHRSNTQPPFAFVLQGLAVAKVWVRAS